MNNRKQRATHWKNQKYILAYDEIPEGLYTIETYAREVLRIKLDTVQRKKFGMMATDYQQANKINSKFVKDKKFMVVRVYEKSLLDVVFMEFAQSKK
jgi:hypothetical protein